MASRSAYNLPDFKWMNDRPLIEVNGLEKVFKTLAGPSRVLKDIHLEVTSGDFVSIIGRSGSGKSTLINMLTGIDHPTAGEIRIGDTVLEVMPEGKMAEWRGKTLGIVFQFFQLLPTMTLLENVLLPMDFCRMYPPAERVDRAIYLLGLVGLEHQADVLPGALSGGQQQCAAVARALANDPPVLVADEPTGNLDSISAEGVLALFETLVRQGKTVLMVTHDRNLAKRAHRSILLSDGEIVNGAVAQCFLGLADDKLLKLSQKSRVEGFSAGSSVQVRGRDRKIDILVVQKGSLRLKHCFRWGATEKDAPDLHPGQWLDMRWIAANCPDAELNAGSDGPAEVVWIEGDQFDAVAGSQFQYSPPGGRP